MPIKPLHTIPTVAQKAVYGAEEGYQRLPSTLIKDLGKPTPTYSEDKRLDDPCINFEDLLNLYLDSSIREAFLTIDTDKLTRKMVPITGRASS